MTPEQMEKAMKKRLTHEVMEVCYQEGKRDGWQESQDEIRRIKRELAIAKRDLDALRTIRT